MLPYIIVGLLAAVGIFFYLRHTASYSKRLAKVGICAAQTYIMFGDTAAFTAARTVCATMSKPHKEQLLGMFRQIPVFGEGIDEAAANDRRAMLAVKASTDDCSLSNSIALKNELKQKSEDWLRAVMKCDLDAADKLFKTAITQNVVSTLKNR